MVPSGDTVAVEYTLSGGIKVKDAVRQFKVRCASFFRVPAGLITRWTDYCDYRTFTEQTAPGQAAPFAMARTQVFDVAGPYRISVSLPAAYDSGEARFPVVYVLDGDWYFGLAVSTADITITPVNDAPVVESHDLRTHEGLPAKGKIIARDVDGDTLSYLASERPNHGKLDLNRLTGEYIYTPDADYSGADQFTVLVDDDHGGKTPLTVNVTVSRSRDAAVAGLEGLPDPGEGRVYQLWMIPAGDPASVARPVGEVPSAAAPTARLVTVGDATSFGVTIEPEGGSLRPTLSNLVTLIEITGT